MSPEEHPRDLHLVEDLNRLREEDPETFIVLCRVAGLGPLDSPPCCSSGRQGPGADWGFSFLVKANCEVRTEWRNVMVSFGGVDHYHVCNPTKLREALATLAKADLRVRGNP